jgi:hypothetical protein
LCCCCETTCWFVFDGLVDLTKNDVSIY